MNANSNAQNKVVFISILKCCLFNDTNIKPTSDNPMSVGLRKSYKFLVMSATIAFMLAFNSGGLIILA